jgi:arylsulfatase A-like enzyme/tetratricopeptide (TPR) repeat protein
MIFALWACSPTSDPQISMSTKVQLPNVVFISMDTTRKDRLGTYGYAPAKSDRIDSFAANGYQFENAYSSIPLTTPAHASMLTGLYPPHHGIRNNGDAILPDAVQTLPETLKVEGFQTVASVSAFVTTSIWNLDQGFDTYFDDIAQQDGGRWSQERFAESVVDDLLKWWTTERDSHNPVFMWAHFYDPHHPHVTHTGYESISNTYDAEIAYMDDQIDRLYQQISVDAPNTIWVLIADHGEAFEGQHGESSHGLFLYDETMRIPWIIQPYPLLEETKSLDGPASVVDLSSTILGMLKLPPIPNVDGIDALNEVRTTPVYMESDTVQQRFGYHPEIAMSDGQHKLMPTAIPHLYDLNTDPSETTNIWKEDANQKWNAWSETGRTLYTDVPKFQLDTPDASVMKQLEALGYMGGSNDASNDLFSYTLDAKDRLDTIAELADIVQSRRSTPPASPSDIVARFESLLKREPQLGEARLMLGQTYAVMDRKEDAVRTFEEALSLNPASVVIALNLANQLADIGQYQDGIAILEGVLERVPNDNSAQSNILRMMSDNGDHLGAIAKGAGWLEETPSPQLQAILGVILVRNKEWVLAAEMLQASLIDELPREHVHRALGHIAMMNQDVDTVIQEYQKELLHFEDPDLRSKLAKLYEHRKDWSSAAEERCKVRLLTPNAVRAHLNCAQNLFNLGKYDDASQALEPARQMVPNGPFVLLLAANIKAKQGDDTGAKKLFEQAKKSREDQIKKGHEAQLQNQPK